MRWLPAVIVAGAVYLVTAIVTASLAGAAASSQMQFFWRLSAFWISAVVFAAHIAYERLRVRSSAWQTAWRASAAVALGALALAMAANVHEWGLASGYRPRMAVALIAWPLLTAVPAFVVALVVAAVLGVRRQQI
jgi:hypothetical protein